MITVTFLDRPILEFQLREAPGTGGGGVCADGIATNSDASFSLVVPSGSNQPIPDTDYNIFVNGDLEASFSLPTLKDETINITFTP